MSDTRPRRRGLRIALIVLLVLIAVPVAAVAIFAATFNPEAYKPRIAEAVKRATGRDLALNGKLHLRLFPMPTIEADDVTFANMAGGSRPQMVTLQRLEARVALWPLLSRHVEFQSLTLVRPDILLETDAAGKPNWRFSPEAPAQPLPQATPASSRPAGRVQIAVRDFSIEKGKLTWRNGRTGATTTVDVPDFSARSASDVAPVALSGHLMVRGIALALNGHTGPLTQLQANAQSGPWPVNLTIASEGATFGVDGTILHPLEARGYAVKVSAQVPALEKFAPLLPRAHLPALHELTAAAEVKDTGTPTPAISDVTLRAGASDLSALMPGLQLSALDVSAPAPGQPARVDVSGALSGTPIKLTGTIGTPAVPLGTPQMPAGFQAIDVTAQAGGGTATAKGKIALPDPLSGIDLAVSAQVPDVAALGPLLRTAPPPLKDVSFAAQISGGLRPAGQKLSLHQLKLTMPQGDVAGDLTLAVSPRISLQGNLASSRFDLDALPAMPAQAGTASSAPPPPPLKPQPASSPARLIPDSPLPLAALNLADADLKVSAADFRAQGAQYRNVAFHLALQQGKLHLDPFSATLPGGPVSGQLSADASQKPPPVSLELHSPGMAVQSVLGMLGLPRDASGNVQLDLALSGAGQSPHEIAASASGHLGLAMAGGDIDNQLVAGLLGNVLRSANLGAELGGNLGRSKVNCLALRVDATHGEATVRALVIDTTRLHVEGDGTMNLGNETLSLQLRPLARFGGTGVAVPVRVAGTFLAPKAGVDTAAGANDILSSLAKGKGKFSAVIGALNERATSESCAGALAIARGQKAPAAAAPPAPAAHPQAPNPRDLLRRLFR